MSNEFWYLRGLIVVVLVAAGIAAAAGFVEISLKQLESGDILTLLLTAIFVALVIERAVEVYANNRFDPERAKIRLTVSVIESNLTFKEKALETDLARSQPGADLTRSQPDAEAVGNLRTLIATARRDLMRETERIEPQLTELRRRKAAYAASLATVLGLAAAIVSVRVLGQFLPSDAALTCGTFGQTLAATDEAIKAAKEAAKLQCGALRFVDVVLTTALLAGGADGIHQIIKRFTDIRPGN